MNIAGDPSVSSHSSSSKKIRRGKDYEGIRKMSLSGSSILPVTVVDGNAETVPLRKHGWAHGRVHVSRSRVASLVYVCVCSFCILREWYRSIVRRVPMKRSR